MIYLNSIIRYPYGIFYVPASLLLYKIIFETSLDNFKNLLIFITIMDIKSREKTQCNNNKKARDLDLENWGTCFDSILNLAAQFFFNFMASFVKLIFARNKQQDECLWRTYSKVWCIIKTLFTIISFLPSLQIRGSSPTISCYVSLTWKLMWQDLAERYRCLVLYLTCRNIIAVISIFIYIIYSII